MKNIEQFYKIKTPKGVLLTILNSFDRKERREFRKFLYSPFFNKRKDVCRLYDCFLDANPHFWPDINRQKLFATIYPGEPFDDSKLRHVMSYLVKLAKTFLMQINHRNHPADQRLHLLEQFKQRGLSRLFEKEWIKTEQFIQNEPYRHAHFYLQKYALSRQQTEYLFQQKREGDMNHQQIGEDLRTYFLVNVLMQNCAALTHQKMSSKKGELLLLDEVLRWVVRFGLVQVPVVAIYYYAVLTLLHPDREENYQQLKSLIQQYAHIFPVPERRDVHLIAINFCIKKLNRGEPKFVKEAFDFYRSALDNGVLLEKGIISPFAYKNILKLGVELKEFAWIDQFLDEYRSYLDPADSENHYTYCRAVFYFNQPNYDEVLKLLQKVEFKDKLYELDARRMLLIIYYENGNFDALESLLESFKTYIRRHKELGYHKENYLNLIRFVKQLLASNLRSQRVRQQLKKEITDTKALAERRWLLSILGS